MITVISFLPHDLQLLPCKGAQPDGSWKTEELDALTSSLMEEYPLYNHRPQQLLSGSIVVIDKNNNSDQVLTVYYRYNYPATIPCDLKCVPDYAEIPKNITIHNIGNEDVAVATCSAYFLIQMGESLTLPTDHICLWGKNYSYVDINESIVCESSRFLRCMKNTAVFFIDTQSTCV